MTEEFLHYIWKFQLYNTKGLKLVSGELADIIKPGLQNFDSGPDFFNSQIRIGKTIWAGNTEIHIKSSDWHKHGHDKDPAYSKIVLHVVWEDDKKVVDINGNQIYTIELKGLINKRLYDKYEILKSNNDWIPCESEIKKVERTIILQNMHRKLIERLEAKSQTINHLLELNMNSWEAVLYQYLAKYFGFKVNAIPFELLSASIPHSVFLKLQNNSIQLSALLFGQAGFLNQNYNDDYPQKLKKEYQFLQSKFNLNPLDLSLWKFMRMRPSNFPTIRIAQFVAVYTKNHNLFQKIIEADSIKILRKIFEVNAGEYWNQHYQFDKPSAKVEVKNIGIRSIDILLINVVIPMLFNYGKKSGNNDLQEKAMGFLETLPAETNSIIKKWHALNVPCTSAFDTQALLQLKSMHCDSKNCLNCIVGNTILKRQNS